MIGLVVDLHVDDVNALGVEAAPQECAGLGGAARAMGLRADLNLIDLKRLKLGEPRLVNDLPAGAGRVMQDAEGYVATFVAGVATQRDGQDTGERPGRLVRSGANA